MANKESALHHVFLGLEVLKLQREQTVAACSFEVKVHTEARNCNGSIHNGTFDG
jgi:hypothetical protein